MNPVAAAAMFGFLPAMLLVWGILPARRALLVTYVVGWMFLPVTFTFKIATGIPEYSRLTAPSLACLLGAAIFRSGPLTKLTPSILDLPMMLWVTAPILTHSFGGNGLYEGITSANTQLMLWGVPWILARAYIRTLEDFADIAKGIVIAGLIYAPLTWIEMKFSPQLHYWVYGSYQHAFNQTKRGGGFRPMVFMQHGLAVGLWMCACATAAVWLAWHKALPRIAGLTGGAVAAVLFGTAVLCRSTYATLLMLAGLGALFVAKKLNLRLAVLALILAVPGYIGLRLSGDLVLTPVVDVAKSVFGKDRGQSLQFRLRNEGQILDRALQRPAFGWGGNGAYLVKDGVNGLIVSVPDQYWVIVLGQNGVYGLVVLLGAMVVPAALFFWQCPARDLGVREIAPLVVLALLSGLFMLDCLMNAMLNPIYVIASASTVSALAGARRRPVEDAAHPLLVPA